ncbi:small nuclear ribonucleoprotein D3 [Angomonas deanei]|uniref:Small nuclear ribonucleoprotein Sm D3 n=1 Tax=Angomonas deanei TaxID=59799 RepID=S9WQM0_9TRYP|nr:small nuclear ribonucleoprotein D3 [Angomonas deanei]EPY42445.1 small nuclear ribonucleoprotein D3 [Angomonas deanei]CAD2214813.1 LSM domain containing protein, putative [Angomonas deanei]|eukprot:EPY38230.1 small nuclear ribonucleoprotein D3 [Angomonas deanei]
MTSIPLKVLHDAVDMQISLEIETGEIYVGTVAEVQDNMNVVLKDAKKTSKSGKVTESKQVLVRGSTVVFFQLPDALSTAPALASANVIAKKLMDKRGDGKGFGAQRGQKRRREETAN